MKGLLRKLVVLVCVMGLIVVIGTSSMAEAKQYKVYVVIHGGIADPFWKVFEKGAMDVAAQYPDLDVVYTGPTVYNLEQFMTHVEAAIAAKPDALAVTLTLPEAMDQPLRAAMAEGMTVVGVNAPDLREPIEKRIPVATYVGENSYLVGVTAATELLKKFTPKRGLYANCAPGAKHLNARGRGWVDTLKAKGIPAEQLDVTVDAVKAAEITAAYVAAHPDTDAIFLQHLDLIPPTIRRLEDDGIKVGRDLMTVATDISPQVIELIKAGKMMFTLDQQQYLQGYLGVLFAYLHAKYGFAPPPEVPTGPGVITKDELGKLLELTKTGYK